jgi:hypothetical protein
MWRSARALRTLATPTPMRGSIDDAVGMLSRLSDTELRALASRLPARVAAPLARASHASSFDSDVVRFPFPHFNQRHTPGSPSIHPRHPGIAISYVMVRGGKP